MLSLRSFHLLFILLAIVGADLFGVWAVWDWARGGDVLTLTLGIVALLGGLGLLFYALRLVRSLDRAHIG
jgi:hypothetical protein